METQETITLRVPRFVTRLRRGGLRLWARLGRRLLPAPGNVLFTLLLVAGLLWAQSVGALPLGRPQAAPAAASTGAIAYQGRLADANGNPLTGIYNMIFRLYAVPAGGAPLWEEQWTGSNGVRVSDGLFNVMLGSLTPIQQSVIAGRDQLWLGITVGTDDEMQPRVQLGSVPFAVQALTVPDGSITTAKIADGAVTQAKLGSDVSLVPPDGSITTAKIADGAVTQAKLSAHPQTYKATHNWSWSTNSKTWTRVGGLVVTFTTDQDAILIMTANGHINSDDPGNPWLYASFFVDGVNPINEQAPWGMEDFLGSYHIYEDNTNMWAPWSFTQLATVGPGSHTVEVKAKVLGGTWLINGAAIQVVVIPK